MQIHLCRPARADNGKDEAIPQGQQWEKDPEASLCSATGSSLLAKQPLSMELGAELGGTWSPKEHLGPCWCLSRPHGLHSPGWSLAERGCGWEEAIPAHSERRKAAER